MQRQSLTTLLAIGVLTVAGVAAAALGSAQWTYFRSDLIRCADAASFGHPACGSNVTGTDPLTAGWVTLNNSDVTVRLSGATGNTRYSVGFVRLHNAGTDVSGPYTEASVTTLGTMTTNRIGAVSATFRGAAPSGPTLGYYVIFRPNVANEFVTGFDPTTAPPQQG